MSPGLSVPATAAGAILLWSFAEYGLHNWYGHLGKGKNDFSREHLKHHALVSYFAPNWKKFAAAIAVLAIMLPLCVALFDRLHGTVFSVVFTGAYLLYEWLHWRAHVAPPTGLYSRWVRMNHFSHHFNNPKHNHGVTSPIWDFVFGTHTPLKQVKVIRKHAMAWLINSATGEILPEFASDYRLVGRTQ